MVLRVSVLWEARAILLLGLVSLAVSWAPVWFSPIVLAAGVLAVVAGALGQHHFSTEERFFRNDCCCMPLSTLTHYFNMMIAGAVLALISAASSILSTLIWKRQFDCARTNCNSDATSPDESAASTYHMFMNAAVVSFISQVLLFLLFVVSGRHGFLLRQAACSDSRFAEVQVPGWVHSHQVIPFPVPGVQYNPNQYSAPYGAPYPAPAIPVLQLQSNQPVVTTGTALCHFCNAPFPPTAHYCSVCGAGRSTGMEGWQQPPQQPDNFCSRCGTALHGMPRCGSCGFQYH